MRRLTGFYTCLLLICISTSQLDAQRSALIIIDIQDFYFQGGDLSLDNPEAAALNAGLVLEQFRKQRSLVVHVRHNYTPGGDIHEYVSPASHEIVVSKAHVNAFRETNLHAILQQDSISDLVICGMQTHMCLEAAVRAGSDLGYNITVIGDACATRALQYGETIIDAEDVHYSTLATLKSYARIIKASDYLIETSGK